MAKDFCCALLRGEASARLHVDTCSVAGVQNEDTFQSLGNISSFELNVDETTITQKDYTTCGGGAECSTSIIDAVNVSITFNCFSAENLARALYGDVTEVLSAVGYVQNFYIGDKPACARIPLDFIPNFDTNQIVIANGIDATVYVEGVDYTIGHSVINLTETTTIPANTPLTLTYDYQDASCVELVTTASKSLEIILDGVNCADGEKPFKVHLYKVKLNATDNIPLITDEFASFTLTGTVLKDPCVPKTTNKLSPYGKFMF